jgi:hypothetical protein
MTEHVPRLSFSLDPLMAEAKRRARQRRLVTVLVAVAAVAAAAVFTVELRSSGSVTPVPAKLTVLAVLDGGGRALFHLRCDPAGGDVAQPAKACAAIAAQPSLVTHPKPFVDLGNNGAYFTITGTLNGKPVHFSGESDWTPQMELITKLGLVAPNGQPLHLEASRHGTVGVNMTHAFAPGVLRPGDLVTCRVHHTYQGLPLAMSVPIRAGRGGQLGAQPGVLAVRVRADGAVVASCLARNQLPLDKRGRNALPKNWPPR